MFKVEEFKWITINDDYMSEFDNWSRPYEYAFFLNKIKSFSKNKQNPSIHNSCCGTEQIHLQFAKKIQLLSNNVYHSDIKISELFKTNLNVYFNDITKPFDKKFDIVICVSTLEELRSEQRKDAFDNLIDQVNSGGHLLLTCDYPDVDLKFLETLLGKKISSTNNIKLNSMNSIVKTEEFSHLNIIAIDLLKI